MIVKNEIEITKQGEEKIKETFSRYTEIHERPNEINWCVIHMYPICETITQDGQLYGYEDSLFFNVHIYDIEKKTVYMGTRNHDAIKINKKCEIRYFKDLSTMLVFESGAKFNWHQDIEIY